MESKEMTATQKEPAIGLVSNCANLRIRKEPDDKAEVLGTIPVNTEVMVDKDKSIGEFYKVYTDSGLEGFCMKQLHHGLSKKEDRDGKEHTKHTDINKKVARNRRRIPSI